MNVVSTFKISGNSGTVSIKTNPDNIGFNIKRRGEGRFSIEFDTPVDIVGHAINIETHSIVFFQKTQVTDTSILLKRIDGTYEDCDFEMSVKKSYNSPFTKRINIGKDGSILDSGGLRITSSRISTGKYKVRFENDYSLYSNSKKAHTKEVFSSINRGDEQSKEFEIELKDINLNFIDSDFSFEVLPLIQGVKNV